MKERLAAQKLKNAVGTCVRKKHFPGAVYLVAEKEIVLAWEALGVMSHLKKFRKPMVPDTIFDIASLTKPLAAAPIFLRLASEGALSPDDRVSKYLPEFKNSWIGEILLKNLALHTSGLPAWRPLYINGAGKRSCKKIFLSLKPHCPPSTKVVYSCLGYILLGWVLEKISGKSLRALFKENISAPLGLRRTQFCPPPSLKKNIAPTELGNALERSLIKNMKLSPPAKMRKTLILGAPHDGNAHHLGGAAGNSGLFSNAWEIFLLARSLLDPKDERVITAEGKKMMFECRTGKLKGGRTFGWKFASTYPPVAGILSPDAVGHNGFTGVSLWIEPERERIYILLTNRVHPAVKKKGVDECRKIFHKRAVKL